MPRKTKKEKLLSEKRKASEPFTYTYEVKETFYAAMKPQPHLTAYVRQDLIKTLILALLFIGFEVGLAIYYYRFR